MDRKTLLIVALCIVFWLGLNKVIDKYYPPPPPRPAATRSVADTNAPAVTNASGPTLESAGTNVLTHAERSVIDTNAPEEFLVATNENARYTFSSHGGGLKLVELLHYPET